MKKLLAAAAALVLAATPAAAQQSAASDAQPVSQQSATVPGAPSIFVSPDEIKQRVAASESTREAAQMSEGFWWLVTAVAVGVVVAALLL